MPTSITPSASCPPISPKATNTMIPCKHTNPEAEVEDISCDLEIIARDLAVALSTLQMAKGKVNGIISEFVHEALDNYATWTSMLEVEVGDDDCRICYPR